MLPAKYQPNPPGGSGEEDFCVAILYSEVPHMLPAKYQPNRLNGSGKEVI